MPIRINLMADALAEEDLRRRDPVKRSIVAGALLVAVSLVWFSSIWLETLIESKGLDQINNEIQTRTNEYSTVLVNQKKITDIKKRLDSLDQLTQARFLQGNLMDAFQKLYLANVQLTRLKIDQNYTATAGSPPVTNSYGVVPGKPPTMTERIALMVDAKDSSANAGDQVNHFKDAIVAQDFFKNILNTTNGVRVSNISPPQTGIDGKPYVIFTVEARFSDKSR